jgi:polyphosphate kinase
VEAHSIQMPDHLVDLSPKINRELSWLAFNARVLQEAQDIKVPLIERLRFLAIFSNNQDEFFRVRVATVRRMIPLGKQGKDIIRSKPKKVLDDIQRVVLKQQADFEKTYSKIVKSLEAENIYIINEEGLNKEHEKFAKTFFQEKVQGALVPIMLKHVEGFPKFNESSIYLAIKGIKQAPTARPDYALMEVPVSDSLSRFVRLPNIEDKKYVILLDDIIRFNLPEIFHIFEYKAIEAYTIKLTRDSELDIENDLTVSYIEKLTKGVKQRQLGNTVRFVYDHTMPIDLFNFLMKKMNLVKDENIIPGGRYHNFKDLMQFPSIGGKKFHYKPIKPLRHKLLSKYKSVMDAIKNKDVLLHYPYHSFAHMVDFLREAAIDPHVTKIQISLYRMANDSQIINALVNAAENGKEVIAIVELQARFDEEANIFWSEKLQHKGVNVIFGVPGLKVHSKMTLVTRMERMRLVNYANISTGNYNEQTAKHYTDLALFTADRRITGEVVKLFSFLEKNYKKYNYRHLLVSPHDFRKNLVKLIDHEIKNAKKEIKASIFIKMNSLTDSVTINKLYEASQAGVQVRLIVRGICSLVPGLPEISENIEVRSIVDIYLEHSRVMIFGVDNNRKFFIGSADLMARNLDHRVEITCPVYSKDIQSELVDLMEIQWRDNLKARIIDKNQENKYYLNESEKTRSQVELRKYYQKQNLLD